MRRAILVLALLFPAIAAAQPRIGAERQLAEPPYGAGFTQQWVADLEFHEGRGFVVWTDSRSTPRMTAYGSRIDDAGTMFDPEGIPIAQGVGESTFAVGVVWLDGMWVAVFRTESKVYARRIRMDGALPGPAMVVMEPPRPHVSAVSIASNGHSLLLVHSSILDNGAVLYDSNLQNAQRLDVPLRLIGGTSTTSDGDGYVIAGQPAGDPDRKGTTLVRISSSGSVLGTRDLTFEGSSLILWTGQHYLVLGHSLGGALSGQRFSASLEPAGARFAISPDSHKVWRIPAVSTALDGSAVVTWIDAARSDADGVVYSARMNADGAVSDVAAVLSAPSASATLALAHRGSAPVLAWTSLNPPDNGLRIEPLSDVTPASATAAANRVETFGPQDGLSAPRSSPAEMLIFKQTGVKGTQVQIVRRGEAARAIAPSDGWQILPAIAVGSEGALAVWTQRAANAIQQVAMPLALDGTPMLPSPVVIATGNMLVNARRPSLIWTGSHYLLAFEYRMTTVRVMRIQQNGTVLDPDGRDVVPVQRARQENPVLARVGSTAILAWREGADLTGSCPVSCGPPTFVRAARLTLDGVAIDPSGIDLGSADYSHSPEVAANGERALVTWVNARAVSGRFISGNGPLGTAPFPILTCCGTAPSMAAHFDRFLVSAGDGTAVFVSSSGVVSTPFTIANAIDEVVAWTSRAGNAVIGYRRTGDDTGNVPRLFFRDVEPPVRRRAAAR